MPRKISTLNIQNKKETLAEFSERYRILSQPETIQMIMQKFTARMDKLLKERLESLSTHPKDTGLLQKSWEMPMLYLLTHKGNAWQVYLNNTATVGQQSKLKAEKEGTVHRKQKRIGRHNLKRYLPFVDKRTKFYTKQLRILKNKVNSEFKIFIGDVLWEARRVGLMSEQEMQQWDIEFGRFKG